MNRGRRTRRQFRTNIQIVGNSTWGLMDCATDEVVSAPISTRRAARIAANVRNSARGDGSRVRPVSLSVSRA